MIAEFDSIFHENGFIFVNESNKDIEAQMAARVDGQRTASKLGHELSTKGSLRTTRKGSGPTFKQGEKTGGADSMNIEVDSKTGGPNRVIDADFHNRREAKIQERRAKNKRISIRLLERRREKLNKNQQLLWSLLN